MHHANCNTKRSRELHRSAMVIPANPLARRLIGTSVRNVAAILCRHVLNASRPSRPASQSPATSHNTLETIRKLAVEGNVIRSLHSCIKRHNSSRPVEFADNVRWHMVAASCSGKDRWRYRWYPTRDRRVLLRPSHTRYSERSTRPSRYTAW